MLSSAGFLLQLTSGRTRQEFQEDRAFRSAVERELQIIGDALLQLDRVAPDLALKITDHSRIIGFRHVLVHGYDSLDYDLVWYIATEKLSILHREVQALLGDGSSPTSMQER